MATVTAFTAARSAAIEAQAVTGATVTGGNLIMTRQNGSTFNAGSVAGPQGPPGPTGDVSTSQLNTAISGVEQQISNSGLGVKAFVEITSQFNMPTPLEWHDVPGMTMTFTPTPGRLYRFRARGGLLHTTATAYLGLRIVYGNSPITVIAQEGLVGSLPAYLFYPVPERLIEAPAGWNVSTTFRLQAYTQSTGGYLSGSIANGHFGTSMYVEDLGPGF
jgi:hypothetical protein